MVATQTRNRMGAHFDTPAPKRELPQTERERSKLWSDVVFDAVLALHNQLSSRSEAVVAAAANSILELERTRMRHDKSVAGTRSDVDIEAGVDPRADQPARVEREEEPAPPFDEGDIAALHDHVREIRDHMENEVGGAMPAGEANAFIVEKLNRWQIRPSQIHRGEFVKMLGLMAELPEVEGRGMSGPAR